ncbi:MAG: CsgG/HfaB family protein [Candidatus Bipolaricaulia bacterium]
MRKITVLSLVVLLLLTGCTAFVREPTAPSIPTRRVAVLDFRGDEELVIAITETFTTSFVRAGSFEVVERAQLEKAIEELKLGVAGILTEASAKEIGQAIGADAIVVGSVTTIGDDLLINTRIIDVETGVILVAETSESKRTVSAIREVADTVVGELTKAYAERIQIAGRSESEVEEVEREVEREVPVVVEEQPREEEIVIIVQPPEEVEPEVSPVEEEPRREADRQPPHPEERPRLAVFVEMIRGPQRAVVGQILFEELQDAPGAPVRDVDVGVRVNGIRIPYRLRQPIPSPPELRLRPGQPVHLEVRVGDTRIAGTAMMPGYFVEIQTHRQVPLREPVPIRLHHDPQRRPAQELRINVFGRAGPVHHSGPLPPRTPEYTIPAEVFTQPGRYRIEAVLINRSENLHRPFLFLAGTRSETALGVGQPP